MLDLLLRANQWRNWQNFPKKGRERKQRTLTMKLKREPPVNWMKSLLQDVLSERESSRVDSVNSCCEEFTFEDYFCPFAKSHFTWHFGLWFLNQVYFTYWPSLGSTYERGKQYNLKMYCKLTPVIGLYYVHYENKFGCQNNLETWVYAEYWGDTISC